MSVHTKLNRIQAELQRVDKSGYNNFSKYSYVTLGDMLVPLRPHLERESLTLTQSVDTGESSIEFQESGYYSISSVVCTTILTDIEDGSQVIIKTPGFATDKNSDKACFKAITGARKYGISCLFALEWFSIEPEDDRFDDKRQQTKTQAAHTTFDDVPKSNKQSRFAR